MLEFYLNTTTREWADRDGNPFRDSTPQMAFLSRETVKIIACTETPDIGGAGVDPSAWTRDSSWAAISGIGAKITVDSDRIHKLKGELASEVAAGSVTGISATITGATTALIPESGVVRLYDAAGKYEAIAYSSRTVTDGTVTFSVDGTLTGSYAAGSVMDCDQAPYCEAMLDTAQSNLEQGEFVFDLAVDSQRLRSEMDYKDTAVLPVAGLELLLFKTTGEVSEPIKAFLCDTFSITGTLGSVDFEAEPPEAMKDRISGTIAQLLAAGFSVEQRLTETGDTEFRFRSASAGGGWSSWITIQRGEKGDKGDKGDNFTVNATGLLSERSQYDAEEKGFSFLATDDGNLYIKNSDTSGDWSGPIPFQGPKGDDGPAGPAGPANTLSIGTVATGEPGTEAAATITGTAPNQTLNLTIPRGSDGTDGADGADGVSSYTYVAYASDASGAGFSLVPSNTLKFRAEIHTTTAIEAPDAEDFAGAAWVKYIGDDGSGAVKSVNGQLPDESGNVTIETGSTVDESRLLPENPANGDIPCYDATVDRGNNADTKLLLQPATSDNEIIDQGKGNTVPLVLNVGANVTVNEAGQIVFTSPNSSFQEADVIMLSKEQAAQLVTGNNEWCVDLVINVGEYVGQQTVMTLGGGGEYTGNADYACFIMSTERGTFWHWNGTEINMNLLPGNTVLVTVEQWIDDTGAWKLSYYANGSHVFTSSGEHRLSAAVQPLVFGGGYGQSSYFRNTVDAIRFRTVAPYRGQSFTPEARPWLPPAGSWQKVNLAELAKTIIADPVTEMAVADETWGDCRYLDAAFRQLSFRGRVRNLRRVSLETVSIDSSVTGNIVLVPIVDGSELPGTSFVVAVGAEPAVAEFALEVASGTLALRRDTDDERDTLKDAEGSVTAVVLSVILEVQP